jgi:gliding motility-associated-like protein
MWFYFKASSSGTLCLSIDPIVNSEDFDWMVFNMNGMNCADISSGVAPIVSCNVSAQQGTSGPNGNTGPTFPQNEPCLNVNQGDEFLLCANFFVQPGGQNNTGGFSLNVEPSSTADIVDNQDPIFISMQSPVNCSEDTIEILFNESILCSTINGANVEIQDASGGIHAVSDVFSTTCQNGTSPHSTLFNAVIPAGLPSGNYTFTITGNVTDPCGNSAQGQFQNFVVNSPITINQNITPSICTANNGAVTINPQFGSAPYAYQWSNGLPASNSQNNLAPGTYYVTVSDQSSCLKIHSVVIPNNNPTLTSNISVVNSICTNSNGSATINSVSNGTSPYTYAWSGGLGSANTINGVASSNYTVTITDDNGCVLISPVVIGNNNTILTSNNIVSSATCKASDGSITMNITNGTAPYTYQWNIAPNPGNVGVINAIDSGSYQVTITDDNGCQTNQTIVVQASTVNLTLNSVVVDPICLTNNGSIDLTPGNGLAPYSYIWSDASLIGQNVLNLDFGNYTVTVSDANGCEKVNTYTLTQDFSNLPILALVNKSNTSCSNTSDGQAEVNSTIGGYGGNVYLWSDGSVGNTLQNLAPGNYQAIVSDIYGCTDTLDINIASPNPLTMNSLTDTTICVGGTASFTASAQGGTPPINYAWIAGIITGGANISDNPLVNTIYEVTAVDGNGCKAIDTTRVAVDFFPSISTTMPVVSGVCQGESATISVQATGGNGLFLYQWNTGSNSQSTIVTPSNTSMYYVTVSNGGSCGNTPKVDSVSVFVAGTPVVQYTSNKAEGCVPVEVGFYIPNYNPLFIYQWTYGDGNSEIFSGDKPKHLYKESGCKNVSLKVISDYGCISELTNNCLINVFPLPEVKFLHTPDQPTNLSPEVTFKDQTENAVSWLWNIANEDFYSEPNIRHRFKDVGDYEVSLVVEDSNGCVDTAYKTITVEYETVIFIPNAFSPNGDDLNNTYGPIGQGISNKDYEFIILNRWGDRVFSTQDLNATWNGTYQNNGTEVCSEGVYTYTLVYRNFDGTLRKRNGSLTLLKSNSN